MTVSLQRTISGPTVELTTLAAWVASHFFCNSATPGGSSTIGKVAMVTVDVVTVAMSALGGGMGSNVVLWRLWLGSTMDRIPGSATMTIMRM